MEFNTLIHTVTLPSPKNMSEILSLETWCEFNVGVQYQAWTWHNVGWNSFGEYIVCFGFSNQEDAVKFSLTHT